MPRRTPADRATVIYEATHRLILRGGVPAATTRAIADEAGLTHSAVRHRFSPQSRLLACAWWRVAEELDGRTTRAGRGRGRAGVADADSCADAEAAAHESVRSRAVAAILAMLPRTDDQDELDLWRLLLAYDQHARHDGLSGDQVGQWHHRRRQLCQHALGALGVPAEESRVASHVLHALVTGLVVELVGWRRPTVEDMPDGVLSTPVPGSGSTLSVPEAHAAVRDHLHRWTNQVNDR